MIQAARQLARQFSTRFGAGARGPWAVIDQAFVGGTSFLTTILLGRDGGPAELGLYSLGFVVFIALLSTQESVLTTPLTIFSPKLQGGRRHRYAGAALAQYMSQALLFFVGIAVAAMVAGLLPLARLAPVMWALSIAVPLRLLLEFARRSSFAELKLFDAVRLDGSASIGQILLMLLLMQYNALTAATAFAAMGVASGVSALVWLLPRMASYHIRRKSMKPSWGKNWSIGRWILARQATMLLGFGTLPWLIAMLIGEQETGHFAACLMLVNLANPLIMAINNLLIPQASRALAVEGLDELRSVIARTTVTLLAVAGALCVVLFVGGDWLMQLFYGESFAGSGTLLSVLAINALMAAASLAPACGLVVLERARLSFKLQLLGVCATFACSVGLIMQFGVLGAAYGYLVGSTITTIATVWAYVVIVRARAAEMYALDAPRCEAVELEAKGAI